PQSLQLFVQLQHPLKLEHKKGLEVNYFLQSLMHAARLQSPQSKQQDQNYFQKVFNSIQDIRKRFFSASEIEGLFSTEDIYQN
ncbi:hypothetical protein IAF53_20300, partial [Acinetobacter baumannii]|nr:hypothetical protein [Acinetobacter baumannii]